MLKSAQYLRRLTLPSQCCPGWVVQGQALRVLSFAPRLLRNCLCFSLKLRHYALGPPGGPSNPTERCQSAQRRMKQSAQHGGVGQPSGEMKVGSCLQRDASQRPQEYASLEDGRGCWWHHLHPKHLCGSLTGDARDKWRPFTLRASH